MNQLLLLRYNFRILMLNNRLLIAFPMAVGPLVVFWMVLTRKFTPDLPAQCVEIVIPALSAFLGAHVLSAEYRSRISAVLVSRPVDIGRILLLRLAVVFTVTWTMTLLTLMAISSWMEPFDVGPALAAGLISSLYLTLLAILFATLFRNALAGFGVAALYWAYDLIPGAPINPYLSLRSLTSYYAVITDPARQVFVDRWWIAKIVLVIASMVLYAVHARLIPLLGGPHTRSIRRRGVIAAIVIMLLYIGSGALLKVAYGRPRLGSLPPNDLAWFRYQFAPFGPLPFATLVGAGFPQYLGEIPSPWRIPEGEDADPLGDTPRHRQALADLMERHPDSFWAAGAADALARMESRGKESPEQNAAGYRRLVDRFPKSPYVGYALHEIGQIYTDAGKTDAARSAYAELLQRAPKSPFAPDALRYLLEQERKNGKVSQQTEQLAAVAPLEDRFRIWLGIVENRREGGDPAGARTAAEQLETALQAYREAVRTGALKLLPHQQEERERDAARADALLKAIAPPSKR